MEDEVEKFEVVGETEMNILLDLFCTFAKIGAFTFGGGYAMISIIDHECVDKKKWITEDELSEVTVIAESTPGPIAINCATYTGYKIAGIKGATIATLGMILPSFLIILIIAMFFEQLLTYEIVRKAFAGIRVAVSILIIHAAIKMITKMMKKTPSKTSSILLVGVFFAIVLLLNIVGVNFSTIYLIVISGVIGFCLYALPGKKGAKK